MLRLLSIAFLVTTMSAVNPVMAQAPAAAQTAAPARPARPPAPTRDPNTPGYVKAKDLPDGANAPVKEDGNFILGPTHNPAPEMTVQEGVPQGTVYDFTMESTDSKIYPGIARAGMHAGSQRSDEDDRQQPPRALYTEGGRVCAQAVRARARPRRSSSVPTDPTARLFTALDNLIAQHRVPVMIAISIGNGSGDAQGSERGLEYDTMSGLYAEFVENEVLPLVEKQYNVKLTKDPDGRATMGGSSGGSCALIMAWYHPELYHRVLTYSGTYVNQQWPVESRDPARRLGVPREPDPQQPGQADAPLDGSRRPRQSQYARQHARLGAGQ